MFSNDDTYYDVKIRIGNTSHQCATLKKKNIGKFAKILCQCGLTQANLGDTNTQLTYMVNIIKEKR